ncbi:unnamed protein product (macronuclear) [Paramecium tetraurelia]|uniref:Carboxypeptidase n=1 Tax=Paramecium tetraurelia TaxID=5888 RepID=A0D997_PARTE|nr:uncharacterized protein GSPATT00014544001 [Paramecium tetraurelia]CAK79614.1 unnamed protein product [Paramecium tetraurelia]|eukprot:XP_001447011.1 hypothetical protein (macronuclear) [Paramecium tetraurelia strain d4-2]
MGKSIMLILVCFFALQALETQTLEKDEVDMVKLNALFETNYQGQLYSGYLSAKDDGSVEFHYLFYPAIDSSSEKPLILWLLGGPGCSSMIAAFTESGPYTFIPESIQFEENPHTWTSFANMLYIESPISVGYSYGPAGAQSDESTAQYNMHALIEFFVRFPNFKNQKFYIGGESYAGIYVPTLTQEIIKYNKQPVNPEVLKINIQGIIIGNGCTDPSECTLQGYLFPIHRLNFFGRHGFISEETYQKIINHSEECYGSATPQCQALAYEALAQISGPQYSYQVNQYNVYSKCIIQTPEGSSRMKSPLRVSNEEKDDSDVPPCVDVKGLYHWFQMDEVRTLLNIDQKSPKWVACSINFDDYQINPNGSLDIYPTIIKNNIRVLILSGDVDGVVPIVGTLYWIDKLQQQLQLNTIKPWRPWYIPALRECDKDQNAGNVFDIEGLTFVSFRNAGHEVPADQRIQSKIVLEKFLRQEYL